MTPYYEQDGITVYCGDCLDVMPQLDEQFDTIITDPPYGLEFMGKDWDKGVPGMRFWQAALEIAKPGAMLLSFGGTRTHHRLMCAIEDAGWEIRDVIMYVYGSGFPKSLDIGKAIDRARHDDLYPITNFIMMARDAAGLTNTDIDHYFGFNGMAGHWTSQKSQPAIPTWNQWQELKQLLDFGDDMDAKVWQLNGRKGKPGDAWFDREILGKMLQPATPKRGTFNCSFDKAQAVITAPATEAAALWDGWGTALKPAWEPIIVAMKPREGTFANNALKHGVAGLWIDGGRVAASESTERPSGINTTCYGADDRQGMIRGGNNGRWPANMIHDGSDEVVGLFPNRDGPWGKESESQNDTSWFSGRTNSYGKLYRESGSAARFFYCAKASRKERGEGNNHPTVKPLALMRYLCRLTKMPTGGRVLDMFAGSGTTLLAAKLEGREAVGIEIDEETCEIIVRRLENMQNSQEMKVQKRVGAVQLELGGV